MEAAVRNEPSQTLSMVLLGTILKVVADSGANATEAICALKSAEAMLPTLGLEVPPYMVIETAPDQSQAE